MFVDLNEVIPQLKNDGYEINDPWDVVDAFEKILAKKMKSKYRYSKGLNYRDRMELQHELEELREIRRAQGTLV